MPTVRASVCSTTTDTQAANVPSPPTTAASGSILPRKRTFHGTRYGRGRSGSRKRSATIAMCAVVNDSIAPKL